MFLTAFHLCEKTLIWLLLMFCTVIVKSMKSNRTESVNYSWSKMISELPYCPNFTCKLNKYQFSFLFGSVHNLWLGGVEELKGAYFLTEQGF